MSGSLYLRPLDIRGPDSEGVGLYPLAGGPLKFSSCELVWRAPDRVIVQQTPIGDVERPARGFGDEALRRAREWVERLTSARAAFAGLSMDRPRIMGVINVTPDSFSDGGERFEASKAVSDGLAMIEAGAELLDVGGESTRPGAQPVTVEEELGRVIPVVEGLAGRGAAITIDTCHARVMAAALAAGADAVNDVTALAGDAESLGVVAEAGVPVILMHMQGEPRSMQADPSYDDAALDVFDVLAERVAACEAAGIPRARIAVDPGIGFGKTVDHNVEILNRLALYHGCACPIVLGVSRKSFIGHLSGQTRPKERLSGSLAAALAGLARGVQILRVHDVAETRQAMEVWQAIGRGAAAAEG